MNDDGNEFLSKYGSKYGLIIGMIAILVVMPFIIGGYFLYLLSLALIWGIYTQGLNIIFGYTGYLNFGMSAFLGIGGYLVAISVHFFNLGVGLTLLILLAAGSAITLILGAFLVKFKGHIFVVMTIAISMILFVLGMNMRWLTGGDEGMTLIIPKLLGFNLTDFTPGYYFTLLIVGIFVYLTWRVLNSPMGRAFTAIKESEERAQVIGYDVYRVKLLSFYWSGLLGIIAGGLHVFINGYVSPHLFFWLYSGYALMYALLGGLGTLLGPFVGALVLTYTSDYFSTWQPRGWPILQGILLIIIILVFPKGIVGYIKEKTEGLAEEMNI